GEPDIRRVAADLGFVGPGDPLPDGLFSLVEGMTPGEISKPFKTEFGYHVALLKERKKSLSAVEARNRIVKTLNGERRAEIKKRWDRALRKNHLIWRSRERYAGVLLGPLLDRLALPDIAEAAVAN
ncbi:MAG: peptidylprolyl isomerase, partial [Candidatus Zixiibacteriota bacterium]